MSRLVGFLLLFGLCTQVSAQKVDPKTTDSDYPLNLGKIGLILPHTDDPELKRVLTDSETIYYKLPQVWQHYIPASRVKHTNLTTGAESITDVKPFWAVYRSGDYLRDFNSNLKFPWETTIGLNSANKDENNPYRTVDFINLPVDSLGDPKPIVVLSEIPVKWIFPAGTTVGEIIYVIHNNKKYVQEIRTRRKNKECTEWIPTLYRPIKDRKEFAAIVGLPESYKPAYQYMFFRNPQEDEVFKMEGMIERLPPLQDEEIEHILNLPFKDCTDSAWSPSADQDFHILPKNYCFGLLQGVDSVTCASCHRQTQITTHNLIPKEPLIIKNPDKDTSIRGCDAVFTWNPFDTATVRSSDIDPVKVHLRPYDTQRKFVKLQSSDVPSDGYKITLFVQEALRPYELPNENYLHKTSKVAVKDDAK